MSKTKQKNIEAIYPLSPMQQGMLFHTIYATEGSLYFEQTTFKVRGKFDNEAFKRAVEQTMLRNPVLRTAFVYKKLEQTLQVVHKEVELPYTELDWQDADTTQQKKLLTNFLQADRDEGFKLSKAPLMRLAVMQLEKDFWQLVWSNHHILFDGWSLPILLGEVFSFYEAYVNGKEVQLPLKRPFREYILWLQKQDMGKAKSFWQKFLNGFNAPTEIPYIHYNTDQSFESSYQKTTQHLSLEISQKLNDLARSNQLTINTIVQGAWSWLLHHYSGEEDVVFGTTVSGRPPQLEGVEQTPGLFINTLPQRVSVNPNASLLSILVELQKHALDIREYEYTPLADIQSWSDLPGHSSLFDSIVIFENYPVDQSMNSQMSSLEFFDVTTNERTNYPITLVAGFSDKLSLDLAFDTHQISADSGNLILQHMERALKQFADNPTLALRNLSLNNAVETDRLVNQWNKTETEFQHNLSVHQVFEQIVENNSSAPALVFGQDELSYLQLNKRINHLAHFLREQGLKPEQKVAIYLDRSLEAITSLMAVMKCGAAYVPIDPEYPMDRVEYILHDSGATTLITDNNLSNSISNDQLPIFKWDTDSNTLSAQPDTNPENLSDPQNLAYIIYTSGSTGKPKGTLLQHRGAVNTAMSLGKTFQFNPGRRVLQFASIGFDASVAEILGALLNGAVLHLISKDTILSESGLADLLRQQKISSVILPPSVLAVLDHTDLPDIQVVGSAGEACTPDIASRWAEGRTFINGYGPTESTVAATLFTVDLDSIGHTVPIGSAMHNARVYVLDAQMRPQPLGIPGELHISSVGLARGYLNRPDLSAEKFIPDPFSTVPGTRLYKSGDLVRWLPDGNLEFLGRIDHQIKLRGFRIELGEIENALTEFPSIKNAAVILREDEPDQKYLAAYLITATKEKIDRTSLLKFLKERLPEYMMPAVIIEMDAFPLTPSGKINRKALPIPDEAARVHSEKIAPRTPIEELLVSLCSRVLHMNEVGINDNFFEIGGHSLLATQMMSRIRDAFEVELPLKDFYENPVISDLALKIEQLRRMDNRLAAPAIERIKSDQDIPLSFSQQRLWFLDQLAPGSANYNIPTVLRLKGTLNIESLNQSLNTIIQRHEVLRTIFVEKSGNPIQVVQDFEAIELPVTDLSHLSLQNAEEQARKRVSEELSATFDLSSGPLFKGRLFKLAHDDYVVTFVMHHTITDGWSMGILVKELATIYPALISGEPHVLDDMTLQYADYSVWQRNWLQGDVLQQQLDFWKELIGENPEVLELPLDYSRPAMQTFSGKTLNMILPAELKEKLKAFSQKEGSTLFMTLLSIFKTLMHRYSGQDQITTGTPIANRTQSVTESLIGFFVNTLVLKADFSSVTDFRSLLKQIREMTLQAYAHQDLPFEKLVDALQHERDMSHSPLFQAAFIMQNMEIGSLKLPDLSLHPFEAENSISKYDLTLNAAETDSGIECHFEYNTDLFLESTIQRMMHHFQLLTAALLENPKLNLHRVDFLSDQEKQDLFVNWNETQNSLPNFHTVPALFEDVTRQNSSLTAASYEIQKLSYQQLNEQANQLARHLLDQGLQTDQIVGICLPRSLDIPIAILGVLKAGGAFLSIDPSYPEDRIRYILEDSGVRFMITLEELLASLPLQNMKAICVNRDSSTIKSLDHQNLSLDISPENLAYVIYTSGSTGKPKGTLLAHRGLVNLSQLQKEAFAISNQSKIMQFASYSFDASVWETVMALLNGANLVYADQELVSSGQELTQVLEEQEISTITLPPSVLAVLPESPLPALKTIITAGEKCTTDLVQRWAGGRQFVNAYGPTETTVCASMFEASYNDQKEPPIGKPVDNFQLYILDEAFAPTPLGVSGELCIGGIGLARGYLNRPDLTADKFIPNSFNKENGSRLYRSGDLARWTAEGNVEFLGRIDHQVKVRGFRIELGEIEAVLTGFEEIRDVAVLAREDQPGDQRLVAYYVSANAQVLDMAELRTQLKMQLPDYMIPVIFMHLEQMPLTSSGKIDRKALPVPELSREALATEYVAPRNETEEKLSAIVIDLLKIEKAGINDNFFELGGHSLLATQFISQIRDQFEIEIPLRKLFESPTISGMGEAILSPEAQRVDRDMAKIERIEREEDNLDDLLNELDGLSDAEAQTLLDSDLDDLLDEEKND